MSEHRAILKKYCKGSSSERFEDFLMYRYFRNEFKRIENREADSRSKTIACKDPITKEYYRKRV